MSETTDSKEFQILKRKYDELLSTHLVLKREFSENFIIQSMNDMKEKYEEKEDEIQYLTRKNEKLKNVVSYLSENLKSINIIVNTVRLKLKEFDRNSFRNSDDFYKKYELESDMRFTQDVITTSLKSKHDILYME
jgi:predicted nuclease with TOPRIM domain